MTRVDLADHRNIVVLTGAGVSVASGLRPYRGPGGLWEEHGADVFADAEALRADPAKLWRFFGELRQRAAAARPNPAHEALARLERALSAEQRFVLLTQNIDGLHQRAGSERVVELHGALARSRCTDDRCGFSRREALPAVGPPGCPDCGAHLRPDIVLFGEPLPVAAEHAAKVALRECDLFIAAGTSGTVSPASSFVRSAKYSGARTLLVNLEPMAARNPYFDEELLGPAEETLPALLSTGTW